MDKHSIDGHKLHYHLDRLREWETAVTLEQKLLIYPIYVEVSPVGHCNHRCTFCAVDYIGYKTRSLDTKNLCNAISQMAIGGVRSIMYAGEGEPMLHKDISFLVNYTKLAGIDVAFTTNATAMTQKFSTACLKNISWVKISMNGGDQETYSKIHQTDPKHWQLVWDNIAYAVNTRNGAGWKTTIGVQCLLLPDNADTLVSLAERCASVGVDYLVIKPYSHNPNSITQTYKAIEYKDYYRSILDKLQTFASSKFEIVARERSMEAWDAKDRGYSVCHSTPFMWAYLMASGELYACSAHIGDEKFNLGNIGSDDFNSIWMGNRRKELIKDMETYDITTCRKNCRMNAVNKFMWDVKNQDIHRSFI